MIIKRAFSSSVHKYYDIVIAGGGMIGTTLACKLSKLRIFILKLQ